MKASFRDCCQGCLLSLMAWQSTWVASEETFNRDIGQFQPKVMGGRIVGGEATGSGFPWMAYIRIDVGGSFLACGGTLINSQWILTAAHCLDTSPGVPYTPQTDPARFTVFLGIYDLNSFTEQVSTAKAVSRVIRHLSFNVATFDEDFALLQLTDPVANTPVQLLGEAEFQETLNARGDNGLGPLLTVVGWGRLSEFGSTTNLLQTVTLPLIERALCAASPYSQPVAVPAFCAGFPEGGKDSCQGDSGGPIYGFHAGNVVQVGVVSYGNGCARPNTPGVYADVTQRIDWIRDTAGPITLAPDLDEVFDTSSSSGFSPSRKKGGGAWSLGLSWLLVLLMATRQFIRRKAV